MADRERLQLGREPRGGGRAAKPGRRQTLPTVDEDAWFGARAWQRYRRRRVRTKRRVAAMTPGRRWARRAGILGTWMLGGVAAVLVTLIVLFYSLSDVPRPESLPLPQVASILYSDGQPLARLDKDGQNRTIVNLAQVPEHVRWAVLAAEDRGFYSEPGVSIKGTLRAALSDLTGGDTQGGSGITQQYVKNAYLSDARTLSRKLKELMIAVKLARQYPKDQILEYYLNTVYFGRGAYGIEAASQTFFNRDVSKLTVAQGAVLAAQLRAPSYYDPATNPEAAKGRWHYVLDGMVATGHLSAEQDAAMKYPPVAKPKDNALGSSGYKALIVQKVLAELEANGISEDEIYARGLRIRTTIDRSAESAALTAIKTTFADLTPQQRNMKNALVAVNPANGAVLAYYGGPGPGGKNYAGKPDEFDYAGNGTRPPGSSFKPYVLATVLTQTLKNAKDKPRTTINSLVDGSYCTKIQGNEVCNDPGDQSLSGPSVLLANAMKWSLNTTFDLLAVQAGPNNVAKTAHSLGIAEESPAGNPTLVDKNGNTGFDIGIGGYPVTPLDQATGFATFANNGIRNDAYFVQKVVASNGEVVYEHDKKGQRVLDAKVANDVTLTLQPIPAWSNDPLADGRVAAAKTGTQGIPGGKENSDAWMVGYTPQVSAAVWVGSGNSTTPIYNSYGAPEYGSDLPGKTWKLFMDTYLAGKPKLPMATTQMVTGGTNTAPLTTPPASSTAPKTTSSSPKPTFSRSTGFAPPSSPQPVTSQVTTSSPAPSPSDSCTTTILGGRVCPSPSDSPTGATSTANAPPP